MSSELHMHASFFNVPKVRYITERYGLEGEALLVRTLCELARCGGQADLSDIAQTVIKSAAPNDTSRYGCVIWASARHGIFDFGLLDSTNLLRLGEPGKKLVAFKTNDEDKKEAPRDGGKLV